MNSSSDQTLHVADLGDEDDKKKKEIKKTNPEIGDEQDFLGHDPDPEVVNEKDTLEEAQELGLYPNATEEQPVPVGEDNLWENPK